MGKIKIIHIINSILAYANVCKIEYFRKQSVVCGYVQNCFTNHARKFGRVVNMVKMDRV